MKKLGEETKVLLKQISDMIIKFREKCKFTQAQVAKYADISLKLYKRIESGKYDYDMIYLFKIGYILGYEIDIKLKKKIMGRIKSEAESK